MSTLTVAPDHAAVAAQRDELVERLFGAVLGVIDFYTIYLGDRLGLYQALSGEIALTSAELAARTGTDERLIREWLEQQAVSGLLTVDDAAAAPDDRRYRLPAGHAEVLIDADNPAYLTPLSRQVVGLGRGLDRLVPAFRTGGGVPYQAYGADLREGMADLNRVVFLSLLGGEWFPAIPALDARLRAAPARLADVACGTGWSSIAIARAYPLVRIVGFDADEESIALARRNVEAEGLSDRISFEVRDAAGLAPETDGHFDVAFVFEAIHDMARPVEALRAMRELVGEDGLVLVVDERVADTFTAPGDETERFMYGASVLFCLPTGMAEQPSAATGTVMRVDTIRRYTAAAGYQALDILPIEHPMFRFYWLRP